jgi:hypothetical protein
VKAAAAPEDAETAAKKNHANQTLNISKTFDGKYRLDGWLGAEAGAEVAAAIEAFTRKRDPNLSVFEDPIGKAAPEALHQLARHATNHTESCNDASPSRHSLIVAITLEALQPGIGTADIQGHGTLTAGAARRLACDWSPAATGHPSAAKPTTANTTSTADPPPNTTWTCSVLSTITSSTKAAGATTSSTRPPWPSSHPTDGPDHRQTPTLPPPEPQPAAASRTHHPHRNTPPNMSKCKCRCRPRDVSTPSRNHPTTAPSLPLSGVF